MTMASKTDLTKLRGNVDVPRLNVVAFLLFLLIFAVTLVQLRLAPRRAVFQ